MELIFRRGLSVARSAPAASASPREREREKRGRRVGGAAGGTVEETERGGGQRDVGVWWGGVGGVPSCKRARGRGEGRRALGKGRVGKSKQNRDDADAPAMAWCFGLGERGVERTDGSAPGGRERDVEIGRAHV